MLEALPLQAFPHAEFVHQVNGTLLKHSGADTFFNIPSAVHFNDHALNSQTLEQVRQEKPSGTGSNDSYLCAHFFVACIFRGGGIRAETLQTSEPPNELMKTILHLVLDSNEASARRS